MIKANELRVANLVYYKDKICPIESIERSGYVEVGTDIGGWVECCDVDDIEPIPLTHKILNDAGFNIVGDDNFKGIIYEIENTDEWQYNSTKLKYLHQLQNLYFALTGEELKIQL
jgi:hypothetical protein